MLQIKNKDNSINNNQQKLCFIRTKNIWKEFPGDPTEGRDFLES